MRILALLLTLLAAPAFAQTADFTAPPLGSDGAKVRADLNAELGNIQSLLSSKLDDAQVSAFALTLLDDATAIAMRATLGLGSAAMAANGDFAAALHLHSIADVTGLQAALDAKLDDAQASAFGLSMLDDGNAAAVRLTLGLGSAALSAAVDFAAALHLHAIADVTGLQAALDSKLDDAQASAFGLSLLDDSSAATARSTLGLGAVALQSVDDDVPDAAEVDDTALAAGAVDGGTGGEIADDTITSADVAAGAVGTSEAAALDAGDVTTGTFADALINGANEADEVNPTLGAQTQGTYVAGATGGLGITVTGTAAEAWSPAIGLSITGAADELCLTYEATGPAIEAQACGGGGSATDLTYDAATRLLSSSTGADVTLPLSTGTDAGLMSAADKSKLDGVAAGATANSADATLLARANHTGTQAQSTVTSLVTDLAAKAPLASPTFTGTVTLPAGQVVNGVTLTTAGGTTNFLRADGTYAAPAGGGGGGVTVISAAPSSDQSNWSPAGFGTGETLIRMQPTSNAFIGGLVGGTAEQSVTLVNDSAFVIMLISEDASSTAANRITLKRGSYIILPQESMTLRYAATTSRWVKAGMSRDLFEVGNTTQMLLPGASTAINSMGLHSVTTLATLSTVNQAGTPTNDFDEYAAMQFTNATASGASNVRGTQAWAQRGGTAGRQGFLHTGRVRFAALGVTGGVMAGLTNSTASITTQPTAQINCVMLGANGVQTTLRIMRNDGTGVTTDIDLGANFPVPSATAAYEYVFFAAGGGSQIEYMVRRMDTRQLAQGSLTTDLPATTTGLAPRLGVMVGGTATASTAQMNYLLTVGL